MTIEIDPFSGGGSVPVLTASRAVVSDTLGALAASTTTAAEIGFVSGVTSAIQTQLNAKQATITGGATTIASTNLTASRALASTAGGKVAVSATTDVELGYVSGVTSAIQTQLGAKMGAVLPTAIQEVFVNLLTGSNTTGTGSYDKPYQTIAYACTQITDSTANKPYSIRLCGARQNETADILLPPYVSIHGPGQRACIIRGTGATQIKPAAALATANSWNLLKDVYISGTMTVNWDLQALGAGSNSVLVMENVSCGGSFTHKGRSAGGGDFLEIYCSLIFGATALDSVSGQLQNIDFIGSLTFTNTQATSQTSNLLNCSIDTSLTAACSLQLSNIAYPLTAGLTTTAAVTLDCYRGLPPPARRTLFAGTTVNIADASVTGPASATDEALARYDGTTGSLVQNSAVTVSDAGGMTFNGTTGFLRLPNLTTTQRDALTALAGMVVFNTTTTTLQYYNGTVWV